MPSPSCPKVCFSALSSCLFDLSTLTVHKPASDFSLPLTPSIIASHLHQFSSAAQSCLTVCDPMDCSTPGFPVHHQLLEFAQTHVHWVGGAIQPSHPLSPPSSPAFSLFQHQGLSQWVSSVHQVAKVLEFQLIFMPYPYVHSVLKCFAYSCLVFFLRSSSTTAYYSKVWSSSPCSTKAHTVSTTCSQGCWWLVETCDTHSPHQISTEGMFLPAWALLFQESVTLKGTFTSAKSGKPKVKTAVSLRCRGALVDFFYERPPPLPPCRLEACGCLPAL